jgi:hypothetical protein
VAAEDAGALTAAEVSVFDLEPPPVFAFALSFLNSSSTN